MHYILNRSIYGRELPYHPGAAAHHEAGHAAMALSLGGYVKEIGLGPDDNGEGLAWCDAYFERETTRRMMLWTLAGNCAERIYRKHRQKLRLTRTDFKNLVARRGGMLVDDGHYAFQELLKSKPSPIINGALYAPGIEVIQRRFERYALECLSILQKPPMWRAVSTIASELQERGKLSAKRVERIYSNAIDPKSA